jgi:hypothetical protein
MSIEAFPLSRSPFVSRPAGADQLAEHGAGNRFHARAIFRRG